MNPVEILAVAALIVLGIVSLGLMGLGMLVVAKVITFALRTRMADRISKSAQKEAGDESKPDFRLD